MFIDSKENKWQISERDDGSIFVFCEKTDGRRVIVYDTENLAQRFLMTDSTVKLRWIGVLYAGLGVLGYMTVADDLEHEGEIPGLTIIFGLGLILLFAFWLRSGR